MSINDTRVGQTSNMTMTGSQKVFSNILQLSAGVPQSFDFKSLANKHQIDNIQGVWIDNSQGQTPFSLTVNATFQVFTVPAGYQGVAPLYVTPDLVCTLAGSGQVAVVFQNFPTPAAVWPASGPVPLPPGGFTFSGNSLETLDTGLAAKTEAGGLKAVEMLLSPGDVPIHARAGQPIFGSTIASGAVILAASGVLRPFVTDFNIQVSANAVPIGGAGAFTAALTFVGSGLIVWEGQIWLNAAPPHVTNTVISRTGLNYLGAPGDSLQLTFGPLFSAGVLFYNVGCGMTGVL